MANLLSVIKKKKPETIKCHSTSLSVTTKKILTTLNADSTEATGMLIHCGGMQMELRLGSVAV